jgi:hypothetical protein
MTTRVQKRKQDAALKAAALHLNLKPGATVEGGGGCVARQCAAMLQRAQPRDDMRDPKCGHASAPLRDFGAARRVRE